MKPTSVSAEALFEAQREVLHWEWVAGHAHPERRFDDAAVRDAQSAADLVGLPQLHPPVPRADRRPSRGGLPVVGQPRGPGAPHLAHRHAGAAGAHHGRRRGAAAAPGRDVRSRRDPAVRDRRVGRPGDRRGAQLPGAALRRAHHAPRRVHGHPRAGRAAHRRVGPGQERARARADFARPRPGGRRRGRSVQGVADRRSKGAARNCWPTCSRCAASACSTSRRSSARPRCAGRCG